MKIRCLIFSVFSLFLLAGCWDKAELNDVSIATGIAIDPGEEKKYKLTVEVVNSSEFSKQGAEGNAPVVTFSQEGNSLSELANKMNVGFIREVIYSHTRVLYINEEVAKEGILGFLDYLERSGHFRNDFNILITDGPASDYTKITYPVLKSPSLKMHQQIKTFLQEWGGDPHIQLTDFIEAIVSKGRSPVASTIIISGDPEKGASTENNKQIDVKTRVEMSGIALFDNEKMVGKLPLEDARNYLWTQELEKTSLTIPCEKDETKKNIDVRIIHSHSKLRSSYKDGKPTFHVDINGEGRLQGTECKKDVTNLEVFLEYEKNVNEHIKKEVTSTIQKVQEKYGVDIFGFGDALNRSQYKKFKEVEKKWNEEFAKGNVEVHVNMHLLRYGIKNKSFLTDTPVSENE
ncbi:Ger(x)C family spore germination protein [Metabacillus litoralis]|uniref:Ger(x)C family spore germination protein n=1 Tax=Metabacillus litoralis TaxID=152268 RepID=UPI001CFD01A7|nr:Ger(x)C family spore germination protein [Metabacillus litoralis]